MQETPLGGKSGRRAEKSRVRKINDYGVEKSRVYKICGHGRKRIYREIKIDYTEYRGGTGSPAMGMDGIRKRNARRTRGTEEA